MSLGSIHSGSPYSTTTYGGASGATGATGPAGATGATGPVGAADNPWEGHDSIAGSTGSSGMTGDSGNFGTPSLNPPSGSNVNGHTGGTPPHATSPTPHTINHTLSTMHFSTNSGDNPTLAAFLKAVEDSIAQLKKLLAEAEQQNAADQQKTDEGTAKTGLAKQEATDSSGKKVMGASDTKAPTGPLTFNQKLDLNTKVMQAMGNLNAEKAHTETWSVVGVVASSILLAASYLLGPIGLLVGILTAGTLLACTASNVAPGQQQDWMDKDTLDADKATLQTSQDAVKGNMGGTLGMDVTTSKTVSTMNSKESSKEADLLQMIKILTNLMMKVMSGANGGPTVTASDVDSALGAIDSDPQVSSQLKQELDNMANQLEAYTKTPVAGLVVSSSMQQNYQNALKALSKYSDDRSQGNDVTAGDDLDAINQALNNLVSDGQTDFSIVTNALSQGSGGGTSPA